MSTLTQEERHAKIAGFLLGEFCRSEGRQVADVILQPAPQGQRLGDPIYRCERRDNHAAFEGEHAAEAMATELLKIAQDYADSFGGGVHRFQLTTNGAVAGKNRCLFTIEAEITESVDDPPTGQGIVAQLMRHNENNQRTLQVMFQTVLSAMARQIEAQATQIKELGADRRQTIKDLEQAESSRELRLLEASAMAASEERKGELFKKFMEIGPMIIARLTGDEIGDPDDPITAHVNALRASLDGARVEQIMKILKPEEQELFMRTVQAAAAAQEAKAKGAKNGASDAPPRKA